MKRFATAEAETGRRRAALLGVVCGIAAVVAVAAGVSSSEPGGPAGQSAASSTASASTRHTATTATPATLQVALIGDSYAAGDGGGSYLSSTDTRRNSCHRSAAAMLAGTPGVRVRNLACSRATTGNLTGSQQVPMEVPPQLGELARHRDDAVVVMIGGNDIDFSGMIQACVVDVEDCSSNTRLVERVDALLHELRPELESAYAAIGRTTTAEVIIPAYPQLFSLPSEGCPRFTEAEMQFGASTITRLNREIEAAAASVAGEVARLRYVGETENAFEGRGVCSDRPLVHSPRSTTLLSASASRARAQELLHPTAEGYEQLTAVLAGRISALDEPADEKPEGSTTP